MEEIQSITLSELNNQIELVVNAAFKDKTYWIVAEVSGHKFYSNNDRHYFTLVEKMPDSQTEVAKLRAVSWQKGSRRIAEFEKTTGQKFTNGIQVLIKVEVVYHVIHELSLNLLDIDPSFTIGNLAKQRSKTLEDLTANNPDAIQLINGEYITTNKKLAHGQVIQQIALITSSNSLGYTDFMNTIRTNRFHYSFSIDNYFSTVQGVDAEASLIDSLVKVFNSGKRYDAVVIVRGGGAKTDFLVFDTYRVARAVARFPIPIITGIGHHEDISVVDLMAHTHTNAPTKAAEFIVAHNKAFEDEVIAAQKAIIIKSQQVISKHFQTVNAINNSVLNKSRNLLNRHKDNLSIFNRIVVNNTKSILFNQQSAISAIAHKMITRPQIITGNNLNNLRNISSNLLVFSRKLLKSERGYVGHFESVVNLMQPVNILKKGFAILYYNGNVISGAQGLKEGDILDVKLIDAHLKTEIKSNHSNDGQQFNL